jgi:anaerobic ribonucleoside-triphosphate reductase activating protein
LHEIEKLLNNPNISGLSILGGDPFEPENIKWVETLCAYVKHNCPDRDIWLWSGYDFLDFIDYPIMNYLDVMVDGRYEADKKDLTLSYRGSWNQRVIDVQKSIKARCAIRLKGDWR